MGVCSGGTPNTLYSFGAQQFDLLRSTLGYGPAVERAAIALKTGPVLVMPVTASVAGTNGTKTYTRVGTSDGAVTLSGAPNDDYEFVVIFTRGAASVDDAEAAFKYSVDGGNSFSPEIALASSGIYAIPNTGVTMTWADAAGTFIEEGDKVVWTSTAPGYSTTNVNTAFAALLADSTEWEGVVLVGIATSAANSATMAGVLATNIETALGQFRYVFACMDAADTTDANIDAAFANVVAEGVLLSAGFGRVVSPLTGRIQRRPEGWIATARIFAIPFGEHPGRVKSKSLKGFHSIERDEFKTPGLDAKRITTVRTIVGKKGYWVTNGNMLADSGSDFAEIQHVRVINEACRVARASILESLNDDLLVDDVGKIDKAAANTIESDANEALADALLRKGARGQASAARVVVDRSVNIISTESMEVDVFVRPKGYAKDIKVRVKFENPAIANAG